MKRVAIVLSVAIVGAACYCLGVAIERQRQAAQLVDTLPRMDDSVAVAYLTKNKSAQQIGGMLSALSKGNAKHNYTEQQLRLCLFVWEVNCASNTQANLTDGK